MKFFQRLNICKVCGVAYRQKLQNADLCEKHYFEDLQERKAEAAFQNWITVNRGRLKAEMNADKEKNAEKERKLANEQMQRNCQAAAQQQNQFGAQYPWTTQNKYGGGFFS